MSRTRHGNSCIPAGKSKQKYKREEKKRLRRQIKNFDNDSSEKRMSVTKTIYYVHYW